jgi:GntR family transcriptional regulator
MKALDRKSPVPLHHQLKQSLVESIESGEFRPGMALPTERELEAMHGVSRITVRRSLQEIDRDGYITRTAGKGTFVARTKINRGLSRLTSFAEEMRERGLHTTSRLLEFRALPAAPEIAEKLGIEAGTDLTFISRLRLEADQPIALSLSYLRLPPNVTITAEELTATGSLWALVERKGLPIVESEKTLEATVANEQHASLLNVSVGAPLMLVEGVSYSHNHYALEYHQVINRADRYRYSIHLRR